MNLERILRYTLLSALAGLSVAALTGCTSAPRPTPTPAPSAPVAPPPAANTSPSSPSAPSAAPSTPVASAKVSAATNARDYRRDAARHLYETLPQRILTGKLPPLLYAVGVLEVELDGSGQVSGTHWLRKPSHAPEVVTQIEQFVRQAAPFPRPARLGRVTYTDTWLWDKSGRFQLDTLTEGQL